MTPEDPEIKSLTFFPQKFFVAPTSGAESGRRTLQVLQPSAVNKNLGRIIEVHGGGVTKFRLCSWGAS